MSVRGIRGATTAAANTSENILAVTSRLLDDMVMANQIQTDDIVAVFFTTSPDLNAEFPAAAARAMGWRQVPLLCSSEIDVPGRVRSCIRVLMLVNTDATQSQVTHVYLEGARRLRPDLSGGENPETAGTAF